MARASALATPYLLPYAAAVQPAPLWSGGRTVVLRVTPAAGITQDAIDEYHSVATAFGLLASTGALGPASPLQAAQIEWSKPRTSSGAIEWQFMVCHQDERAAVVLAQWFLTSHTTQPLRSLSIAAPGNGSAAVPLVHDPTLRDPYPPAGPTPFPIQRDPDPGPSASLYVRFARTLNADEQADVNGTMTTWASACSLGAFGVAPVTPSTHALQFGPVRFFNSEVEFDILRFRAHPAALNGLVNLCVALHFRMAPIDELRLD